MSSPVLRVCAVVATVLGMAAGTAVKSSAQAASPLPACAASAFSVRDAGAVPAGPATERYVLHYAGGTSCRMSGSVGVQAYDARRRPIPMRFAPRVAMPLLLTVAPGAEASFTLDFGAFAGQGRCARAASVAITLANDPQAISGLTHIVVCPMTPVRVSNLQLN